MIWIDKEIELPRPKTKSGLSLEEVISSRRSHRAYTKTPLDMGEISQLLFAGQGLIGENRRTVPSAGALCPIEIYLVVGKVKGIPVGIYKYLPKNHSLFKIFSGDKRKKIALAAFSQFWVEEAPITIIICGNFSTTTVKYGKRGERFVVMEVGHVAQNICLQSTSLGLGSLCVGGFDDKKIKNLLGLKQEIDPFYLITAGKTFKNWDKKETEIVKKFYKFLDKNLQKNVE